MFRYSRYSRKEGPERPLPEAYSRVTNPERFRPLHTAMQEMIGRLENDFEVDRTEGYGLDEELERRLELADPCVRLSPRDTDSAPITVAFTTFPGLHLRFGRWYKEPFPGCGCDACDESAEGEIERLNEMVDAVTAGGFSEAIRIPLISFRRSGWREYKFRSSVLRSSGGSRIDGPTAHQMSGGRRRLDLDWKPWPRRQTAS